MPSETKLTARIEPFDSFWEGPEDVESGYKKFGQFYRVNYLEYVPTNKQSRILVVSCGPGYFVNLLHEEGYTNIVGIDSFSGKIQFAQAKGLNCQTVEAIPFLKDSPEPFDVIICEQELNHLTKDEIIMFLNLCWNKLSQNGALIVHGLNGANPITGAEALAQNFDHFNTFTEYSLRQVLTYCGYDHISVIPLNLYVFYSNPFNYIAWFIAGLLTLIFRFGFILYGKHNRIFTKKIAAVCQKNASDNKKKQLATL